MKQKLFISTSLIAAALVALALLPLDMAGAQGDPTATPPALSDFVIPTSTPAGGGGLAIPTATQGSGGGGFTIPTSTPGAPAGPALPPLTDEQLASIPLQPGDVPGDFAASRTPNTLINSELLAQIREQQGPSDLADLWEQLITTYGWDKVVSNRYQSCQPTVPISEIYSEVSQLKNPDAARAFVNDPGVQTFLNALGYSLTPDQTLHGWRITLPGEGECFAEEMEYAVAFEYWGTILWISMTADANTDPGLVNGLLDQVIPVVIGHVDALAPSPFPATPVPGDSPAPTPIAAAPTEEPLPTATPTATATLAPPPTEAGGATIADIDAIMPTIQELGLPTPTFALNQQLSGTYTLDQLVTLTANSGQAGVAAAVQAAGQRNGFIGQVTRVWDTGSACPDTVGLSIEVDVALMQTAQGAQDYVADTGIQGAWAATGLYTSFTPSGGGILASGMSGLHPCGNVQLYAKYLAHGRFVILASVIGNAQANREDILSALDILVQFMTGKIDEAGLQ